MLYKIDTAQYAFSHPFCVFRLTAPGGWFSSPKWEKLDSFQTVEEAKIYMAKVAAANLPIYSEELGGW